MKKLILLLSLMVSSQAFSAPDAQFYRDLTMKLRNSGEFQIPFPGLQSSVNYSFKWDKPIYAQPILIDLPLGDSKDSSVFMRSFYDRIFFTNDSVIEINGEKLPLTCVFINGQDNRYIKDNSPLLPDLVLKVYLVANDFNCQGPTKPGWPQTGGKEQTWDTYLYYEIRDPTIMLPTEAKLRYRWNEYNVVLVDKTQP